MKTKILYLVMAVMIFSCSKESVNQDETIAIADDEVLFNTTINYSRLALINRTILPNVPDSYYDGSGRMASSSDASVTNQQEYFWTWVAKVDAPTLSGETLSATHCSLIGNKAYVSYHKQGNQHLGIVDIMDISDPANPSIIEQITFPNADINAITAVSDSEIWVAASHEKHGATVYKLNANADTFQRINLSNSLSGSISASANGIDYTDDYIIVTAGKTHGGTFFIDRSSTEVVHVDAYSNAKYVGANGKSNSATYATMVTGDIAGLKVNTINDFGTAQDFTIGEITHTNVEEAYRGKNTLQFNPYNSNRVFCAMGLNGLKVFDINSGALTNESKGSMLLEGNTNAVTLDDDYMYIANGADGIAIADHISDGDEINPMFVWDMAEQPASANYVTAKDDWIFVCKGLGGFNILYKQEKSPYITVSPFNERGTPIVMEDDEEVCSELLPNLFSTVLPEGQNALTNYPEYFDHPTKNILIKETSKVFVTFINEGAGYKNALGYYAYDTSSPPESVDDLIKVVVFPNASASGSGGELIRGNTVKLLGEFEAGTELGFFVISDGWRGGQLTDGFYTQHTDAFLNGNGAQQSLIFHDTTCNSTIICFEDISVPHGDKDYNDAIFQIKPEIPSAIDPTDYILIE